MRRSDFETSPEFFSWLKEIEEDGKWEALLDQAEEIWDLDKWLNAEEELSDIIYRWRKYKETVP